MMTDLEILNELKIARRSIYEVLDKQVYQLSQHSKNFLMAALNDVDFSIEEIFEKMK